ncbi:hypothetical protein [Mucilaginibacter sp.]|uniref:hypothetical protein n=1 Tax=Mucilaginibacter sp. TaxID=1882438 RepID=UPI003B00ED0D
MKTSDKELDDLFASGLDNFEAEPTANLWQNISIELDRKTKKKSIIPILRIAAGVVVVFSVGLLFLRKDVLVKNPLPKKTVKVVLQKIDPIENQIQNLGAKNSMLLLSAKNKVVKEASAKAKIKTIATQNFIPVKPKAKNNLTQTLAQVKPDPETENQKNNSTQIALAPDISISLNPQPEEEIVLPAIVKPTLQTAVNVPPKTKHKRIRSIGDVVNLVMAKVDKREDKLIQFTDNDDGDESNVTGINLGFISIKKEK